MEAIAISRPRAVVRIKGTAKPRTGLQGTIRPPYAIIATHRASYHESVVREWQDTTGTSGPLLGKLVRHPGNLILQSMLEANDTLEALDCMHGKAFSFSVVNAASLDC